MPFTNTDLRNLAQELRTWVEDRQARIRGLSDLSRHQTPQDVVAVSQEMFGALQSMSTVIEQTASQLDRCAETGWPRVPERAIQPSTVEAMDEEIVELAAARQAFTSVQLAENLKGQVEPVDKVGS